MSQYKHHSASEMYDAKSRQDNAETSTVLHQKCIMLAHVCSRAQSDALDLDCMHMAIHDQALDNCMMSSSMPVAYQVDEVLCLNNF